jgi:hypothetical protein
MEECLNGSSRSVIAGRALDQPEVKVCFNGDSLRAGKLLARFLTRGSAMPVSE